MGIRGNEATYTMTTRAGFIAAAGAVASTLDGAPVPVHLDRSERSKFVIAATPELHDDLLELLVGDSPAPSRS